MNFHLLLIAIAIPAYLLGSVNGSIIASMCFYRKDIREYGSGNPGLTNFYRVFGKGGALLVILIDAAKTILPVLLSGWLLGRFVDPDMVMFGRLFAGMFVLLGTCYPVFYKFKGGRGVLVEGTILIIVDWRLALIAWGVFIIITLVTRYVSLASILGAASFPVAQAIIGIGGWRELIAASLCAILIIARHHPNIGRLVKGEESKINFSRKKEEE
ncbi:MAG: glycerol-3-phosphate 1-O-acyltransferase PlsY [Oscillospiraceae bacterium]|nr:glycerol-3-phosphate 1-O-acyltransferase PlsY [Oscillospiraceae bacterium]